MPADQLACFLTRTARQGSRKNKGLACQTIGNRLLPSMLGINTCRAQAFDYFSVGAFGEKFDDTGGDFGSYLGNASQSLLIGFLESLHRTKMPGQQLGRALAHKTNAQRVDQPRKVVRLTRGNFPE